jgi:hypothetical protein
MGILLVLIFWGVIGSGAAIGGGLLLRGLTNALTCAYSSPGIEPECKETIRFASCLPLYCLIWVAAVFIFQAVINNTLFQHDIGIGDSWSCPLPNGYAILMIDVTDQGTVFNPKTQGDSSVSDQSDAISGVSQLQIAGTYILGAFDSDSFKHFAQDRPTVNGYFILDTRAGTHVTLDTESKLQDAAAKLNLTLHLQPIDVVYQKYRYTWFDYFVGALILAFPIVLGVALIRQIVRIRNYAPTETQAIT